MNSYIRLIQRYLPSPFSIAVLLSLFTFLFTVFLTKSEEDSLFSNSILVLGYWEKGFWDLLSFAMQMSLILLLGHTLALSKPANKLIDWFVSQCGNPAQTAAIVSFVAIALSFINWGLCLIFGAILARKVAEHAQTHQVKINYPLIGAAAYSGMLAWHAGFSGSAPLTVAEPNHFLIQSMGQLSIAHTILTPTNLITFTIILFSIPALFYAVGRYKSSLNSIPDMPVKQTELSIKEKASGSECIDYSKWPAYMLGVAIITAAIVKACFALQNSEAVIDLNYVNFLLLGSSILLHGSFHNFLQAVQAAIGDISGIVIQFPLYAGIMGMMKYSGLAVLFSDFFVSISTTDTLAIYTFISAAIVNTFIPSGGGQWAIQGPVIMAAAKDLGIPLGKIVMALSYGDQITNMLQPFWALPLLGITKLKAKEILPYSTMAMILAGLIYCVALYLW